MLLNAYEVAESKAIEAAVNQVRAQLTKIICETNLKHTNWKTSLKNLQHLNNELKELKGDRGSIDVIKAMVLELNGWKHWTGKQYQLSILTRPCGNPYSSPNATRITGLLLTPRPYRRKKVK